MAVQFAQPYRFSEQQLARMADAGIISRSGTDLIGGVPYRAGAPIRFSAKDYEQLGNAGVLGADERVELIGGEVIAMSPVGGPHSTSVFDLDDYLHAEVGPEVRVAMNANLRLPDGSDVVPDLMLLRRDVEVRGKLPVAEACILVVEVADSSAEFDRSDKRELYAWASSRVLGSRSDQEDARAAPSSSVGRLSRCRRIYERHFFHLTCITWTAGAG